MRRAHIPALQRLERRAPGGSSVEVRVVSACTRDVTAGRKRLGGWGEQLQWYTGIDELLSDSSVDVVDLAAPIPLQLDLVRAALLAGKHVISEKPICGESAARAEEVLRLLETAERPLAWCVLENWACKPGVRAVRDLLEEGALGQPLDYRFELVRTVPPLDRCAWRQPGAYDGYWLTDVVVHVVRALRIWFGEPCAVSRVSMHGDGERGTAWLAHCGHDDERSDSPPLPVGPSHAEAAAAGRVVGELSWHFVEQQSGRPGAEPPSQLARVRVRGSTGALTWDADAQTIVLERPPAEPRTVRVQGDGWVSGGVREALADAMLAVARAAGQLSRGRAAEAHHTSARDALCDLRVVQAILAAARAQSAVRVEASPLCPVRLPAVPNATGTRVMHAALTCMPLSARDVAAALRGHTGTVAVVGTEHSWTCWGQAEVSLRLETRRLEYVRPAPRAGATDATADGEPITRVRVGAGTLLSTLLRWLAARGLTLAAPPMLLEQTVGGAIAFGSHGSSLRHGTLSNSVTGVCVVTPAAAAAVAPASDARCEQGASWLTGTPAGTGAADEQLAAWRAGCGMLGVVVAVELEVVPAHALSRCQHRLPMLTDDAAEQLVACARSHEHAWAHWRLGEAEAVLTCLARTAPGECSACGGEPAVPQSGRNWFARAHSARGHDGADAGATFALPAGDDEAVARETGAEGVRSSPADGRQDTCGAGLAGGEAAWVSSEYAFPLHRLGQVMGAVHAELGAPHAGQLLEIKLVAAAAHRPALLAVNGGGQDVACFNVWWRTAAPMAQALLGFERLMQRLGGIPHLGKAHHAVAGAPDNLPCMALSPSERLRRFEAVRHVCDPAQRCRRTPMAVTMLS